MTEEESFNLSLPELIVKVKLTSLHWLSWLFSPAAASANPPSAGISRWSPEHIVRAHFGDLSMLEYDNPVSVGDSAQAVGDHQTGAAGHQVGNPRLNGAFALGIKITRRLVENQNLGIGQYGAGNRDPLTLPAAELDTPLADQRIITLGQYLDKLRRVGHAGPLGGFRSSLAWRLP